MFVATGVFSSIAVAVTMGRVGPLLCAGAVLPTIILARRRSVGRALQPRWEADIGELRRRAGGLPSRRWVIRGVTVRECRRLFGTIRGPAVCVVTEGGVEQVFGVRTKRHAEGVARWIAGRAGVPLVLDPNQPRGGEAI